MELRGQCCLYIDFSCRCRPVLSFAMPCGYAEKFLFRVSLDCIGAISVPSREKYPLPSFSSLCGNFQRYIQAMSIGNSRPYKVFFHCRSRIKLSLVKAERFNLGSQQCVAVFLEL